MYHVVLQEKMFSACNSLLVKARTTTTGRKLPPSPLPSTTRSQLVELATILLPFAEATDILQGDGLTASLVIPTLVGTFKGINKIVNADMFIFLL